MPRWPRTTAVLIGLLAVAGAATACSADSTVGSTPEETFALVVQRNIDALHNVDTRWLQQQGDFVCNNLASGTPLAVLGPSLLSRLRSHVHNLDTHMTDTVTYQAIWSICPGKSNLIPYGWTPQHYSGFAAITTTT